MSLPGANDQEKLLALTQQTHKEQIIWFLNAFWNEHEGEAEKLWNYKHKCDELDSQNHENGTGLDEMAAHRLLEIFHETLTVRAMRENLRSSGAVDPKAKVKLIPIIHILIFKYGVDWRKLVNASQGDNKAEIEEAQRKLAEVQLAMQQSEAAASAAAQALLEAEMREAAALKSAEESRIKEEENAAAQKELEAALAEVQKQEDAYNQKTETLKKKSEEGGVVSRNRAKNELAQHLGEDPLPLRRAKITAEAAVKKAERATKAAAEARAASLKAAEAAAAAKVESAAKKAEAEKAVEHARQEFEEAEAYLEEVKSKPGQAMGALWWIERQLHEQKKYLPESKGGIRK